MTSVEVIQVVSVVVGATGSLGAAGFAAKELVSFVKTLHKNVDDLTVGVNSNSVKLLALTEKVDDALDRLGSVEGKLSNGLSVGLKELKSAVGKLTVDFKNHADGEEARIVEATIAAAKNLLPDLQVRKG